MSNEAWNNQTQNIEFEYSDTDVHANEMSELYSYTEENEFHLNRMAFEELMKSNSLPETWFGNDVRTKLNILERLTNYCEHSDKTLRMTGIRSLLYLIQGAFGECTTIAEQAVKARENIFILYEYGIFTLFIQLLYLEIDFVLQSNVRKPIVSLNDSTDLRLILSALYTFVEVFYSNEGQNDTEHERSLVEQFKEEISQPLPVSNELLAVTLFQMVTKFCNGSASQFPIKKVLLLLWKVLLISLGGIEALVNLKNTYRANAALLPVPDDTILVAKSMRPASPPLTTAEVIENKDNGRKLVVRPFKRQMMIKQTSMIGEDAVFQENGESEEDNEIGELRTNGNGNNGENGNALSTEESNGEEKMETEPRPASPPPSSTRSQPFQSYRDGDQVDADQAVYSSKRLPWIPKVRSKDIDLFLENTRMKFLGYTLPGGDQTTLAGLPEPILEGIRILKEHVYISLSDAQMKREEEINKFPLTASELDETSLNSPAERLYQAMLPNLPQYMIALLKILLAAAPTSKAKTEPLNILSDVLPEEMPMNVFQSMKLGIDVNRHKEIIIKAVSAVLLLLLKHYKINHVYQFEYISQQLMFANCIPLVLKFFNQNLYQYITSKNTISVIDFPACVIGEQPELTTETLEIGDAQSYCHRNLLSSINLARILNKLTKWKHSRIIMLVVFKSAPIFKRALRFRQSLLQLYFLKLLKMQAKYMGRQWRKFNMKIMSCIYQKVRHRLTDDWAYGNDIECRPWDFQAEEFTLQANINRFHSRRYDKSPQLPTTLFATNCNLNGSGSGSAAGSAPGASMSNAANFSPMMGNGMAGNGGTGNGLMGIGCNGYSFTQNVIEYDLLTPIDNNLLSVLSQEMNLTSEFKYNYDTWLEKEVFQYQVDWDQLITSTNTTAM